MFVCRSLWTLRVASPEVFLGPPGHHVIPAKSKQRRLQALCSFARAFRDYLVPRLQGLLGPPGRDSNPSKSKQDACKPYVRLQELLHATSGLSGSLLGHPLDITWASRKIQATTPASPMFFFSKSLSRLLGASLARLVGTSRTSLESRKIQARRLQNP